MVPAMIAKHIGEVIVIFVELRVLVQIENAEYVRATYVNPSCAFVGGDGLLSI